MKILAKCVYIRIMSKVDNEAVISRRDLLNILRCLYHIPKEYESGFIKELKSSNIITGEGKGYYIINRRVRL